MKDVFLITSYIKRKFASIKKDIEYDKEKAKEVEKLADYLDEILNRNICNFIRGYYLFEKKNSIKYYHWKYENICYHNPHKKYFGYNAFDFLEKYLKENIYEKLNIFGYRIYESLDGFYNFNIDDFTKKVIEKEEEFLKWM